MTNGDALNEAILEKLDTLIRLQARMAVGHLDTQKDRILFLGGAGLGPKAIGEILGTTANHANVVLVQGRKKKDQSGKEKAGGKE